MMFRISTKGRHIDFVKFGRIARVLRLRSGPFAKDANARKKPAASLRMTTEGGARYIDRKTQVQEANLGHHAA